MKLVIGNKTYSSWSLRPWILMRHHQIPLDEILIKLDTADTAADIAKYSPAGRVPILIDGSLTIWDSMAIMEYLHEKFPEKNYGLRIELNERALVPFHSKCMQDFKICETCLCFMRRSVTRILTGHP